MKQKNIFYYFCSAIIKANKQFFFGGESPTLNVSYCCQTIKLAVGAMHDRATPYVIKRHM